MWYISGKCIRNDLDKLDYCVCPYLLKITKSDHYFVWKSKTQRGGPLVFEKKSSGHRFVWQVVWVAMSQVCVEFDEMLRSANILNSFYKTSPCKPLQHIFALQLDSPHAHFSSSYSGDNLTWRHCPEVFCYCYDDLLSLMLLKEHPISLRQPPTIDAAQPVPYWPFFLMSLRPLLGQHYRIIPLFVSNLSARFYSNSASFTLFHVL
jgi:hypothetical protein